MSLAPLRRGFPLWSIVSSFGPSGRLLVPTSGLEGGEHGTILKAGAISVQF